VIKQLDPEAQVLLDVIRAVGAPALNTLPVEQARAQTRAALLTRGQPLPLHDVEDVSLPSPHGALPLRLYRPRPGVLPIALFLHGGGWVLNDLDTHDHLCRRIARRSGWMIAALDYRLAPEHRHPAAIEDARFAYDWLLEHAAQLKGDASLTAAVGESAGGAIVAALTLRLRDAGAPQPAFQVLAYPCVDPLGRWPSHAERGTGYTLDNGFLQWSLDLYLPADFDPRDPHRDPYLSPLAASDLSGLAPALVMTAEYDPLRDEGEYYAEALHKAGVPVEMKRWDGMNHGFVFFPGIVDKSTEAIDESCSWARRVFGN
jgi:acetyl esterase